MHFRYVVVLLEELDFPTPQFVQNGRVEVFLILVATMLFLFACIVRIYFQIAYSNGI